MTDVWLASLSCVDGDELLDADALMSADGKQMADKGPEGIDEESIKNVKEKGKHLREQLDQAELKKTKPPKGKKKPVTIAEDDFSDDIDDVEEIKVSSQLNQGSSASESLTGRAFAMQDRMKKVMEDRKREAQERAGALSVSDSHRLAKILGMNPKFPILAVAGVSICSICLLRGVQSEEMQQTNV